MNAGGNEIEERIIDATASGRELQPSMAEDGVCLRKMP